MARAGSKGGAGGAQKKSAVLGTMLPVILDSPNVRAWLMAWRSMARFTAWRTRRSCQGDFGSHWSAKDTQWMDGYVGFSAAPGVRRTSSASSPIMEKARSTSPRLSATSRVAGSGITRRTRRLTAGGLRQ